MPSTVKACAKLLLSKNSKSTLGRQWRPMSPEKLLLVDNAKKLASSNSSVEGHDAVTQNQ